MWKHGAFHWNELMTHDPHRARTFYEDTIGWRFEPMPMADGMTYWVANTGDGPVAGIFEMKGPEFQNVPENWMPYLAVDDVDKRLEKAVAAGAIALREPFDVPSVGRLTILKQPGGGVVGWMTPTTDA